MRPGTRLAMLALALAAGGLSPALTAQTPRTHRLEATPTTVAYGYYWAEAAPVLRVASGDVIDVDTLLTNTPAGLERAGVAPDKVQPSLRRIVTEAPLAGCERDEGVDHIALARELMAVETFGWPATVGGQRLSDHEGAGALVARRPS